MRIKRTDTIGGVSAERVRYLVRRFSFLSFGPAAVREELHISTAAASKLMNALARDGYIEPTSSKGFYRCTLKASTLASATLAPPLRNETAERLVNDVIARAHQINANTEFVYRIRRIELFGSVLRGAERPSDVDLAVTLEPKLEGEDQRKGERRRIVLAEQRGRRFANMTMEFSWPRTEVLRALKNRARGISFADGSAPTRLGAKARVIFEASSRSRAKKR